MPEDTRHYNSGVLAASVLAGVRTSGTNPLGFLAMGGPARLNPAGLVSWILGNAAGRMTDTRASAKEAYQQLFSGIRAQFAQQSAAAGMDPVALRHALDTRDGFIDAMDWND